MTLERENYILFILETPTLLYTDTSCQVQASSLLWPKSHKAIKIIVIENICIVLYSLQSTFIQSISLDPPSNPIRRQRINYTSIQQLKKLMMKEVQLFALSHTAGKWQTEILKQVFWLQSQCSFQENKYFTTDC